jgi:hypothetical protein
MKKIASNTLSAARGAANGHARRARYEMTTPIAPQITTPDWVDTCIGRLEFFDGIPTPETAAKVYERLDFSRAVEAFLNGIPAASMVAQRTSCYEEGLIDGTVGIFQNLMDSKSLFLTANTESIYFATWIDLKNGPVVVESPPNVLGAVNDFWFRHVTDLGNAGPDSGKGGKYLILPPDYEGSVPDGYFVFRSRTYGNMVIGSGFLQDGSTAAAVQSIKQSMRVYSLSDAGKRHGAKFVELSGAEMNTVHPNDFEFFEELDQVIQEEPEDSYGPDMMRVFNAIGLAKGRLFAPDARMTKILTDAVAVGNATARSVEFRSRIAAAKVYPDGQWTTPFVGGHYEWLTPGSGSQYACANLDAGGQPFDGGKTYRLHVPPKVPAKDLWSLVLYDTQTRSMLQTDQQFPSLSSQTAPKANADGSVDVYFSPERPHPSANWVQTIPYKSWFTIFRLYGPSAPWFDKTWRLPDLEEVR